MEKYNTTPFSLLNGIGPIFKVSIVLFLLSTKCSVELSSTISFGPCFPLLIQKLNKSTVCSGMVQFVFVRLRKMAQICVVKLQRKNR
uniref:Putative ovule protein n=1 Tax=Solanum chacoense TaxID=4108 RepID=A0A0V0GUI1_SOLCH